MQSLANGAIDRAEDFALASASTPLMRDLIARGFIGLRAQARAHELLSYVHLPLLLHAALTGDAVAARPLAVATTLVAVGADALDDLADGEKRAEWNGAPANQIELAAVALLSVLPHLALSRIPTTRECMVSLHEALASGLLTMIEGQLADIAEAGAPSPDPESVQSSVEAKSGGELAMFARLTALLGEVDRDTIEGCSAMGRAMGVAGQIGADCVDIFQSDYSDDLANGTRTLPIALHLSGLANAAHERFLRLLDEARHDRAAQLAVRGEMLAAGCVRQCALIAAVWIQKAHHHLSSVARFESPAGVLRDWIQLSSFERTASP